MAPFLYEKIPLTDYHFGNPSTGFSVEPRFAVMTVISSHHP
jgi:hypothetical protein